MSDGTSLEAHTEPGGRDDARTKTLFSFFHIIVAPGRPRMQTWVGGRLEWADRGSLMPFLLTL